MLPRLVGWCAVVVLTAAACTADPAPRPVLSPKITVAPKNTAEGVSPIEPVKVRAGNGKLDSVSVTNPDGKQVAGTLSADKAQWTSTEPLGYGRKYTVTATARGDNKKTAKKTASFTTVTPARTVYPSFFPPPSITTVGVGQPIAVIFDEPPADRVAAEKALTVTATPSTEGGWYWWNDRTVHWRPKEYWRAGTKVTVEAKIFGVKLGDGMYGETDRTLNYTIGPAKVATVDDTTHQMTVTVDGQTVRTFPVSMGREGSTTVNGKTITFATPSGTYVAQEKYAVKQMTSASYGLPNDDALGYDSQIPLAVRISNSGIFVHAAPWSVADQGVRNVSHGCVNLSPEAGQWFYDNFGYGDVVTISNTGAQLAPTDGFGDWNIPWDEWVKGSAVR